MKRIQKIHQVLLLAPLLAPTAATAAVQESDVLDATVIPPSHGLAWTARAAEHLLNRAGFGARPVEIRRWVEAGPQALVDHLLSEPTEEEPFFIDPLTPDTEMLRSDDPTSRRRELARLRNSNRRQSQEFLAAWVERMVTTDHPLHERMTLFWHGFLCSGATKVRLSAMMIRQNEMFSRHALGNYGDLLRDTLRDPAMLVYLDNITSKREHPNENLARELMELFSLGEGNYTEADVQEVARALTGYGLNREREFAFEPRQHDFGKKVVLGVEGRHDAQDVVDILLAQPACARWIVRNLLEEFEGVEPSDERVEEYAAVLRQTEYELSPLLRRLFLDPDFYREEVVGAKILGPVDYMVGICRRTGLRPRGQLIVTGATFLGQQLFEPPNVEGWHGGYAWITTSSLMNRGNMAGVLLGTLSVKDLAVDPVLVMGDPESEAVASADPPMMDLEGAEMDGDDMAPEGGAMMAAEEENAQVARERSAASRNDALRRVLRLLDTSGYNPRINISARILRRGARTEREIVDYLCDSLLAVEAPPETRSMLTTFLRAERRELERDEVDWHTDQGEFERLLRRLAHLILSLPEAQLG